MVCTVSSLTNASQLNGTQWKWSYKTARKLQNASHSSITTSDKLLFLQIFHSRNPWNMKKLHFPHSIDNSKGTLNHGNKQILLLIYANKATVFLLIIYKCCFFIFLSWTLSDESPYHKDSAMKKKLRNQPTTLRIQYLLFPKLMLQFYKNAKMHNARTRYQIE